MIADVLVADELVADGVVADEVVADAVVAEQGQGEGEGGATAAPPAPVAPAPVAAKSPKDAPPKLDQMPQYKVLLHNDDVNDFEHVCATLMELFAVKFERAFDLTSEADKRGLALVMVTHKELAELKAQQLQSKRLTASIEPA